MEYSHKECFIPVVESVAIDRQSRRRKKSFSVQQNKTKKHEVCKSFSKQTKGSSVSSEFFGFI
jgi:hypothetical protein